LLFLASVPKSAAADYRLTILHTNDFHARFEPISKYDSACDPADNALVAPLDWQRRLQRHANATPIQFW
jgi:2',3'-cyclic-nucleotide 2'-phosphodiesterase (5'-nucleotidase family)